jgi:hypothetical protein
MKNLDRVLAAILGLFLCGMPVVWADSDAAPGQSQDGGNQLMKDYVHWYEKGAETVGPVEGMAGARTLTLQPGSFLYVEGGSTLHNYQMTAKALEGSAVLKGSASPSLITALQTGQVKAMTLVIPLKTLNSRDSGLDKNAYQALQAKDYPEIKFKLTSETLTAGADSESYVMTALGTVTVAGQSAPVTLRADATFQNDQVRLKGVQELKMTDFKIIPPKMSILIVSVTCTDQIEIHYDVTFGAK